MKMHVALASFYSIISPSGNKGYCTSVVDREVAYT